MNDGIIIILEKETGAVCFEKNNTRIKYGSFIFMLFENILSLISTDELEDLSIQEQSK